MSVVKSLALGASILGSMVAPTLAGSMRLSHQVPDRPSRVVSSAAPTSLVTLPAPPSLKVSAENLASLGVIQPMQTFANSFNPISNAAASAPLVLGTTGTAGLASLATQPAPIVPVASFVPATPVYTPSTSTSFAAASAAAAAAGHSVDAFINFGNGTYSEAQSLTTGSAQAWYQSPSVQAVYHGTPTADQQAAFRSEVLQVVQNTYHQSGLNVSLTTDPTQNYAHTMSVVSGASYSGNSQAIGITDVGNDGFSFIDKFGMAKTPDELAMAIGHNVAHELMHAFGIAAHPDQTGTYLDAASANWSTLTSAQTTFSPQATQMLAAQNFLNGPGKEFTQGALGVSGLELLTEHHPVTCHCPYCNSLRQLKSAEGLALSGASPVPEPTTIALWGFAAVAVVVARRRGARPRFEAD